MPRGWPVTVVFALGVSAAWAQTTQGLISGQIIDAVSGGPVTGAAVLCENSAGHRASANSGRSGTFALPLLSPGVYRIRVESPGYQSQELHEQELAVAGRLDLTFRLRPLSDIWERGQFRSVFLDGQRTLVTFYGPDVDPSRSGSFEANRGRRAALETTVSSVVDSDELRRMPLVGRDVYTMLVLQPGVTADSATGRGLGLSVNGQRPSASNFMLDGLENNNYLLSGPFSAVAPEAVQEYRVSTNNFSAEYGKTSGYLANAITRAGTSSWHGLAYGYFKNDALNGRGYQSTRSPLKEMQAGFALGGPLRPNRLFFSLAFEATRFRSAFVPQPYTFPTIRFAPPQGSLARRLLDLYPAPAVSDGERTQATVPLAQPSSLNRYLALPRLDAVSPGGAHRLFARLSLVWVRRPDLLWSPYKDFTAPLGQRARNLAVGLVSNLSPRLVAETKLGFGVDDLRINRPHPEIPTLVSGGVQLPGSRAFYDYRNHSRNWELLENLLWTHGSHVFKAGAGLLHRHLDGYLTAALAGYYSFANLDAFAADSPNQYYGALARDTLRLMERQQYDRDYSYTQFSAFAEDSWKVTSRLALNFGLRYESFGAPSNTGQVKDAEIELGSGSSMGQRLASAKLVFPGAGDRQLYAPDRNDWAVRFGFSYALRENGNTVLRGAYGIFYDRPFDNLWQNLRHNNFILGVTGIDAGPVNYLAPASSQPFFRDVEPEDNFSQLTLYQPGLRDPYVQSYFLGLQQKLKDNVTLEINTLGALGRKLLLTDEINRELSAPAVFGNPKGRFQADMPTIHYRSNQGASNYNALTASLRYGGRGRQIQAAYTWAHSIDNQSEPLKGDFFNLDFAGATGGSSATGSSALTRQFDSRVDRGNSDFDQRHNLVIAAYWDLPSPPRDHRAALLLRDWTIAGLAAVRSGFPYSVTVANALSTGATRAPEYLLNNRANLIDPNYGAGGAPAAGGQQLLRREAFLTPLAGVLGNTGRNAFQGPGFYGIDVSLARAFPVRFLGEAGRVTVRADAFNVLNHANLNLPESRLFRPDFGVAKYGRQGRDSGFPALLPLNETPRQVQLLLRVEF